MLFLSYGRPKNVFRFKSGGDVHFIETCKRWIKNENKVFILSTEAGNEFVRFEGINLEGKIIKVQFDDNLCNSSLGSAISYIIRICKALKYTNWPISFDIICAASHFLPDIVLASIISKRSIKSKPIVYLHHLIPHPTKRSQYHSSWLLNSLAWISQKLALALIKKYDFYIFTFQHVKKQLIKMGFSEKRIKCIINGVDLKFIHEIRPAKESFEACFVGRISPLKGVFDLVDIWRYVCNVMPDAKLAIIGHGQKQYVKELTKRTKSMNIENNLRFFGTIEDEEKFAVLKSSKVFVFPSYEEGWGIAVCEAMACKLPVVAYDLPAYEAFGDAIIKVPVGKKRAFAEAVLKLLSYDEKRKEYGNKGKNIVVQFDWDNVAGYELSIIKEII